MIRVKLPNGQYGNFPDEMPHDQIEAVLQKQFPSTEQPDYRSQYAAPEEEKGVGGIVSDVAGIPGKVLDYAVDLPGKASEGWEQIVSDPGRALKNVAAGAGETAIGAFNLPYQLAQYLKEKEIPYFKQTADYVPHVGDLGVEKAIGLGDEKPGDEILRQMFLFAGAPKIASNVPGISKVASKLTKADDYKALKSKFEEYGLTHEQASQALKEAESESLRNFGASSPDILANKSNKSRQRIVEMKGGTEKPEAPYSFELSELSSRTPNAESLLNTKQQRLAELEGLVGEHLGTGQLHHERFGTLINEKQEKVIAGNREKYKRLEDSLTQKPIKVADISNKNEVLSELRELVKTGNLDSPEVKRLSEQLANIDESGEISARQLLASYRGARDHYYDALYDAKTNPSDELRIKARERAKILEKEKDKLYDVLKNNIPGDDLKLLEDATAEFRDKIVPMRSNSLAREIKKTGKVKGSIIEKLVGNEEGLPLIQEMVGSDPELMRLVVGQKYAKKPSELHEPDELVSRYLPGMPELQKLVGEHKGLTQEAAQASKSLEEAKLYDVEKSKLIKQKQKKEAAYADVRQKIKAEEQLIKKQDVKIAQLKDLKQKKDISLKEKVAREQEYKEAVAIRDKMKRRVKRWGLYVGGPLAGAVLGTTINNIIPGRGR